MLQSACRPRLTPRPRARQPSLPLKSVGVLDTSSAAKALRRDKKRIKVRGWRAEDIPAVIECHRAAYPEYDESAYYTERFYDLQLSAFPEGQVLAELDGAVVGYATSLIVQLEDDAHTYTYEEITGGGTFATHDPSGDTLYGADIAVHLAYRGLGISTLLYEARQEAHAAVQPAPHGGLWTDTWLHRVCRQDDRRRVR